MVGGFRSSGFRLDSVGLVRSELGVCVRIPGAGGVEWTASGIDAALDEIALGGWRLLKTRRYVVGGLSVRCGFGAQRPSSLQCILELLHCVHTFTALALAWP